jgi:hypothetical protein
MYKFEVIPMQIPERFVVISKLILKSFVLCHINFRNNFKEREKYWSTTGFLGLV